MCEEFDGICCYVHVGMGNYYEGIARFYEDLGLLSADFELVVYAAAVFNELTVGIFILILGKLLVVFYDLCERFIVLIWCEVEYVCVGCFCGI